MTHKTYQKSTENTVLFHRVSRLFETRGQAVLGLSLNGQKQWVWVIMVGVQLARWRLVIRARSASESTLYLLTSRASSLRPSFSNLRSALATHCVFSTHEQQIHPIRPIYRRWCFWVQNGTCANTNGIPDNSTSTNTTDVKSAAEFAQTAGVRPFNNARACSR